MWVALWTQRNIHFTTESKRSRSTHWWSCVGNTASLPLYQTVILLDLLLMYTWLACLPHNTRTLTYCASDARSLLLQCCPVQWSWHSWAMWGGAKKQLGTRSMPTPVWWSGKTMTQFTSICSMEGFFELRRGRWREAYPSDNCHPASNSKSTNKLSPSSLIKKKNDLSLNFPFKHSGTWISSGISNGASNGFKWSHFDWLTFQS